MGYSRNKIGRNQKCPCGSGKKYKHCCGSIERDQAKSFPTAQQINLSLERHLAQERRREEQQGLGRPILSANFKGYQFVAVGNRPYFSKDWATFHDFLLSYIIMVLGEPWGNAEIQKPKNERHPIIKLYQQVCLDQKHLSKGQSKKIKSADFNGAIQTYLSLAYNLYLLAHNVELQGRLLKRLKNHQLFHGALYETYVASCFIKAGFEIEFEDEKDGSSTHCEFVATHPPSGRKFSVEAKTNYCPGVLFDNEKYIKPIYSKEKFGRKLADALKKDANFERVVFIDLNLPERTDGDPLRSWPKKVFDQIPYEEKNLKVQGSLAPPAYLIVSNFSYHHNLSGPAIGYGAIGVGFKIPDFGRGKEILLSEAIDAREKHRPLHDLFESMQKHFHVPATFDGSPSELTFRPDKDHVPLLIGNDYIILNEKGEEVMGRLVEATVLEKEKKIYGIYKLENGKQIMATSPINDTELKVYRESPETFFGVIKHVPKGIENALDAFDFLFSSYKNTPKEKLLEFMSAWPHQEKIQAMSQKELSRFYCENMAGSIIEMGQKEK